MSRPTTCGTSPSPTLCDGFSSQTPSTSTATPTATVIGVHHGSPRPFRALTAGAYPQQRASGLALSCKGPLSAELGGGCPRPSAQCRLAWEAAVAASPTPCVLVPGGR